MEFLRKHYEKVILSVVLALLAIALAMLPGRIETVRTQLQEHRDSLVKSAKNYQQINMTEFFAALSSLTNYPVVKLSGEHNLFVPVLWLIDANGQIVKVVSEKQVGPDALKITKITPLYFIISLERISGSSTSSSYMVGITDESAIRPADRKMKTRYISLTSKNTEFFKLVEVKGEPGNPEALVLELTNEEKKIEISKDKPYKEVRTYIADMRYDLENAVFTNKRINDVITFAGDSYKIEDIRPDEVVLVSETSTRRFIIKYTQQQ
ncbi:MAG TPA: hypothetical protein PLW02_05310 [Verrucomicrobiota bacterium]|nr:hypothetical protein [Verrucomicrobiota bacterium]